MQNHTAEPPSSNLSKSNPFKNKAIITGKKSIIKARKMIRSILNGGENLSFTACGLPSSSKKNTGGTTFFLISFLSLINFPFIRLNGPPDEVKILRSPLP